MLCKVAARTGHWLFNVDIKCWILIHSCQKIFNIQFQHSIFSWNLFKLWHWTGFFINIPAFLYICRSIPCMKIHKEGFKIIVITAILFAIVNLVSFYFISFHYPIISWLIFIVTLGLLLFIISFFRRLPANSPAVKISLSVQPMVR